MQLSTVHGNRLIRFYLLIYIQSAAPQLDFFYLTVSSTLSQEPTLTSQVHHSLILLSVFLCGESMFVYMVLVSVCITTRLFVCTLSTDQRSEETRPSTTDQRRNVSCCFFFKLLMYRCCLLLVVVEEKQKMIIFCSSNANLLLVTVVVVMSHRLRLKDFPFLIRILISNFNMITSV